MDIEKLPEITREKMEKVLEKRKTGSMIAVNNNADYPTCADVYHTISTSQYHEKRLSVPTIITDNKLKGSTPLLGEKMVFQSLILNRRNTFSDKRIRTTSESSQNRSKTEVNRPLYRQDIFFGASLTRLPQYTSKTSIAYNLSVTHIPTKNDIIEETESRCQLCPEAVKRTLTTMLDFSLLTSPSFILFAASGALTMMGFFVPFAYMTDRAILSGMSKEDAMWLISAIGIANTVGRVLCGVLSSATWANTLFINNAALTIGGLATIFSGFSLSEGFQFTYAVIFGLAICKY